MENDLSIRYHITPTGRLAQLGSSKCLCSVQKFSVEERSVSQFTCFQYAPEKISHSTLFQTAMISQCPEAQRSGVYLHKAVISCGTEQ